jgi:DNA repair protein RecO (recombination protein O)
VPRNFVYHALALRVKPTGESNREAWFLTAEEGLIKATLFGGSKSRLRSQTSPFHEGKLMIYHDPVRDSRKVSDFDVQSWRPGIRECWERAMSAAAVAETILASHGGGGNWQEALELTSAILDILNGASAGACQRITVCFFWRWAQFLGVKPDLSACASCACEVKREEPLWYSAGKEALFCEKCAKDGGFSSRLGPGARLWLKGIESLPVTALERVTPDIPSLEQAKAFSEAVLAAVLEKRPNFIK